MAFDNPTRNRLNTFVGRARQLITEEFTQKFQSLYGIALSGELTPLNELKHLDDAGLATAALLRARIDYLVRSQPVERDGAKVAVARLAREQAFTVLNRLAAVRMAEKRELIVESVGHGFQSKGFQVFDRVAGKALGDTFHRYRRFLFCLFDELSVDLGVLFDRRSPQALLFPREPALLALFELINAPELDALWAEDETIGWIYQYYNEQAERKTMREQSSAPRNSRELAVRNQFFTPRYVVEFLTDNTLGRIWYEMMRGETTLKEQCRYLVRRPNEIFLKAAEAPPADAGNPQSAIANPQSQEELLRAPVHIPHRPLKDPRTILMLDPACGSMHFGLYAFDLFEVIYAEAWDLEEVGTAVLSRPQGMKSLHETYADKQAFQCDVPRLIIEHNLHGIDIDPRCAQIAGLSLWLRAQRAWKEMGIAPAQRPAIKRSNIVCAEPMPGEKELLREFVEREFPAAERAVYLRLLEAIFDKMQLAGEAGSLLKIEEEIRSAIAEAKKNWEERRQEFFDPAELAQLLRRDGTQQELPALNPKPSALNLTDESFWNRIEERIYAALRDYAEQAENGGGFQRRLFAEDAARGFAFIDICKKRYDVALMNPPFGDASLPSRAYIEDTYGDTKGDVYKAFVECFHARLVPAGYLGIISSRTGFFLGQSEDWRTRVVLRLFRPIALADLGMGVLDAMVEVAAYVLRSLSAPETRDLTHSIVPVLGKVGRDSQDRFSLPKWQAARGGLKRHQAVAELEHLEAHGFVERSSGDTVRYTPLWNSVKKVTAQPEPVFPAMTCFRLLLDSNKEVGLTGAIGDSADRRKFACNPGSFALLPGHKFAYWVTDKVRNLFSSMPLFKEADDRLACVTNPVGDDQRYFRCFWEPPTEKIGRLKMWAPLAKGGEFRRYYADQHLVMRWDEKVRGYPGFLGTVHRPLERPASCDHFFRPGLTYSTRSQRGFSLRVLPADTIFHAKGPGVFVRADQRLVMLGLLNSSAYSSLLNLQVSFGSYEVGIIQRTPIPSSFHELGPKLRALAFTAWKEGRSPDTAVEASHAFHIPALLATPGKTLAERAAAWAARVRTSEETVAAIQAEIDDLAFRLYGLDAADRAALTSTLATEATGDAEAGEDGEGEDAEAATADGPALAANLLGYGLGVAFGRWDIRYATGEQAAPELPDPFAPLPVCPPGQLQNAQGLPARPEDVPAAYPVRIPWDGILVDDPNHPLDLERRVREVIEIIWKPSTLNSQPSSSPEAIEHEASEILEVTSLRDYFRKPAGFFADHLKRYSKSRRQAPIYWPLSTASGSYTLWIYYHRLTDQTLHTVLADFLKPKIKSVEQEISGLRGQGKLGGHIGELQSFLDELLELRDEIERVIKLPWKPNLNDGVLITAAPLWKLFRLGKWQKDLKACWEELEAGDYDWAHLAYTIWPIRVREKCKNDRSLAIAHGLENICEIALPKPKKEKKSKKSSTVGEDGLSGLADDQKNPSPSWSKERAVFAAGGTNRKRID